MRTFRPAALSALLLLLLAAACERPQPAPAPNQAPTPALWKVVDEDSVVWLFGTVHLLPKDVDWRSPAMTEAFAAAEAVYLETPSDPGDPEAVARTVARLGAAPPERLIASAIESPAERARIAEAARRAGFDPAEFLNLRPWYAAVRLTVAAAVAEGHSPEAGVDLALEADARAAGKPVRYFESFDEQLGFLAGLSPDAEQAFLRASLRQLSEDADMADRMDGAWVRGDIAEMEATILPSIAEAGPEVFDAVLTRRNVRWADVIAREMEGEGVLFVGVGSAHLVGEQSLVAELQRRGFTVAAPAAP